MNNLTKQSGLVIPDAPYRPGEKADYSELKSIPLLNKKPNEMIDAKSIIEAPFKLISVLDENGKAKGEWVPKISLKALKSGLTSMLKTRAFDERMLKAQRQGKISFYVASTGEEAVSVAQAFALQKSDMLFPSYRQQGLLVARDKSLIDMMCHCFSNVKDEIKGRQIPGFYSWKEGGFFTISGNLATQFSQAVGWAMAAAYKGEENIASTWIGDGSTAEADFHYALNFASVYNAPVILNVVNNQWAISSNQSVAGGTKAPFAARGIGYGIPSFRVDGNDFLAVYSLTQWAAKRARSGGGPTLIELFTYRAGAHSSSDDPTRYRSKNEEEEWPFGDPIDRLKQHLIHLGKLSQSEYENLTSKITEEVRLNYKEAESYGTMDSIDGLSTDEMFNDVYAQIPSHLERQKEALGK